MRTHSQSRTRLAAIVLGLAACYGAGRWTRPARSSPAVAETASSAAGAEHLARAATPASALVRAVPRRSHVDRLPADFTPNEYDRVLLATDDHEFADFVAHGLRDEVIQQCHAALPQATDATCQGVYAATAEVSPKFVATRKRFLRGELTAAEFQSLWHQHFLEREIALEQFMTWDDQLALDGVPPGNDMFMTLDRWGIDRPDDSKIGIDKPQEVAAEDTP